MVFNISTDRLTSTLASGDGGWVAIGVGIGVRVWAGTLLVVGLAVAVLPADFVGVALGCLVGVGVRVGTGVSVGVGGNRVAVGGTGVGLAATIFTVADS